MWLLQPSALVIIDNIIMLLNIKKVTIIDNFLLYFNNYKMQQNLC